MSELVAHRLRRRLGVVLITAAAVSPAAVGCGGSDHPRTVERTKVKVVQPTASSGELNAADIFDRFSNGVVTITSLFGNSKGLADILGGGGSAGQGSGFVLDEHGLIATNAHVITEGIGKKIKKAHQVYAEFADGNQVSAKIIGFDPNADVGLIKVDPSGLNLVPLTLGSSSGARVGESVLVIGSPFGEQQSLSVGVVSATNRTIEALTDFQIGDAIQTDAAINRGNSGGPLLNARGQVIGISSQIKSSGGGSEGVGFAVPIDTAKRSLAQLRSSGTVKYGFLGVSSQPLYPQLAKRLKLPVTQGALVADVVKGGPAERVGIKGGGKEVRFQATLVKPGGDLIAKVNQRRVTRAHDLGELISRFRPGDTVTLEVFRGSNRRTVKVKLGERPAK